MKRDGHNNVSFFIGGEIEKTPAFGKKTLFVVGRQDVITIEKHAKEHKTPHIFMGANHSFNTDQDFYSEDGDLGKYWDKTITILLDKGFMVTLDYPAHQHEIVLKTLNAGIWQSRNFIPLLSVRIPKIETSSPNLTVKIDDIDFNATNAGVWCMHFHEVTDSNRFTDWNEYSSDLVIGIEDRKVLTNDVGDKTPVELKQIVETVKATVEEYNMPSFGTEIKNQTELGLDVKPTTALKADPNAIPAIIADIVKTPEDAAAAYAGDAKVDPLGKEASRKPKAKK